MSIRQVCFCCLIFCQVQKLHRINPLNAKLNPICHLLALSGAHLILHVSRLRVKCVLNCILSRQVLETWILLSYLLHIICFYLRTKSQYK
jgi:hypothetical protein